MKEIEQKKLTEYERTMALQFEHLLRSHYWLQGQLDEEGGPVTLQTRHGELTVTREQACKLTQRAIGDRFNQLYKAGRMGKMVATETIRYVNETKESS